MVVHPRLVGVLLRGRSAWKALTETDYFVLQQHPRQAVNALRIITRGFPHYRVAEGDSVELLQDELEYLSKMVRVSIQGKITSKKISSWLKATFARNSILTIAPPGANGLQSERDSQDHLDHSDHDHHHDGDGYLSDTSNLSAGEVTDPDSANLKTRPPLRRAISLDDLTTSTAIHHQFHSWGMLNNNRMRSRQQVHSTHLSHPTYPSSQVLNQHLSTGISPVIRPASAASAYNRHQHSGPIEQRATFVPLKDRPQSAMSMHKDHVNRLETYSLSQDRGDHSSLPTPEASLEELSDSSDELVIIQGELLEEARSIHSVDRIRSPQHRHNTYPGASGNTSPGADPRSSGDLAVDCDFGQGPWSWLTDAPFVDALVNWIEGPEQPSQQKSQDKDKPNPWFDIPLQFIALLTYPEPDPKNGNKMTLTMVRETSFVRQRRRTLLMLTTYTLIVRYCSFDFFLVVLFASNCAMLFLMKNSGRMNVNMAKRAVRQRVGWAKQWAGGIFKRGGNNNNSNNNANHQSNSNNGDNGHCGNIPHNNASNPQHHASTYSPAMQESTKGQQASPAPNEDITSTSAEASPQTRRRGLFGKRISVGATNNHPGHNASAPAAASTHGSRAHQSDGASVMTAATQKRRFFRRAQNNTPNHTTTLAPPRTNAPSSSTLLRPQRACTGGGGGASTATLLAPRAQTLNNPLSSSPLAQSLSLPHLYFSPPKDFNPHMPASDATLVEGEEAKGATRTRPMAHTPPLSLSTKATPLRQSLDIPMPPSSVSLSLKTLPAEYPRSGLHSTSETIMAPMPIPVSMASPSKRAMSPPACSTLSRLLYRSEDGVKDEILSSSPPSLLPDRALQPHSIPSSAGRGRESVLMLDAVTSASADAMDDL